jgi:hypothetical protein
MDNSWSAFERAAEDAGDDGVVMPIMYADAEPSANHFRSFQFSSPTPDISGGL